MSKVEQFFKGYEEGANSFDADLVTSQFTESFMAADPNGALCMSNDLAFRDAIPKRKELFESIGFRSAKILGITETSLDERYTMAKVHWRMIFEKQPGHPQEFEFDITYFLFDPGSGPQVVFYISHESEQQVMQEAGLIDAPAS